MNYVSLHFAYPGGSPLITTIRECVPLKHRMWSVFQGNKVIHDLVRQFRQITRSIRCGCGGMDFPAITLKIVWNIKHIRSEIGFGSIWELLLHPRPHPHITLHTLQRHTPRCISYDLTLQPVRNLWNLLSIISRKSDHDCSRLSSKALVLHLGCHACR